MVLSVLKFPEINWIRNLSKRTCLLVKDEVLLFIYVDDLLVMLLKAAGNSELLTFTDSDFAFCEETRNQGNKITSQEVPQKLSFMLCLRKTKK